MNTLKSIHDALSQFSWDNADISAPIQLLREHWGEAFPILKQEIESAGKNLFGITEVPPVLFFVGILLCAELKEQRLFPLLMEILDIPEDDELMPVTGFLPIHQMGRILNACATVEQLKGYYCDKSRSESAISTVIYALANKRPNERWQSEDQKQWFAAELKNNFREKSEKSPFAALAHAAALIMPDELKEIVDTQTTSWSPNDKRREFIEIILAGINSTDGCFDLDEPVNAEDELLAIREWILDDQWEEEWFSFKETLNKSDELLEIIEEFDEFSIVPPDNIGPNERCPCGSGKKFKKCCCDSTVVRARFSRISYQENLIATKDQHASDFMLAGYLFAEEYGDSLQQLACWIHCAEQLRPLLGNGTVTLKTVEHKRLFIGCTPLHEWISDFCRLIYQLYVDNSAALSEADAAVCWMLDKFSGLSPTLHGDLLSARGIIRLEKDQVLQARVDLSKALSLNPENLIARFNLIRTILREGGPDAKQSAMDCAEEGRRTAPDPDAYDNFMEDLKEKIDALAD
ncbi:MAG: SEC-C domain-containing protein [Pontiellaceae bacterium]|nr:SEC-C domain-containing protein [Pontiellaceae bacterium]